MFTLRLTDSQASCSDASQYPLQNADVQSSLHSMHCPAYGFRIVFSCDGVPCQSVGTKSHSNHYCSSPNGSMCGSPSDTLPILFQFIHQFSWLAQNSTLSRPPELRAVADSSVSS